MNLRPFVIFAASLVVVPGCGEDENTGDPDAPPGTIDASADAGTDGPPGTVCGGFGGDACAADQYCDFAENGCGAADETGICVDRPTGCPDPVFEAHCGCDGMVYGNDCDAYMAGTDLNAYGSCPIVPAEFPCGYLQCDRMTEYCQRSVSDVGGEPDGYACLAIPACPSQFPNCACLATEPCGHACTGNVSVGLTLTCPGG